MIKEKCTPWINDISASSYHHKWSTWSPLPCLVTPRPSYKQLSRDFTAKLVSTCLHCRLTDCNCLCNFDYFTDQFLLVRWCRTRSSASTCTSLFGQFYWSDFHPFGGSFARTCTGMLNFLPLAKNFHFYPRGMLAFQAQLHKLLASNSPLPGGGRALTPPRGR